VEMVEKQEDNSAPGFTCRRPGEAGGFILNMSRIEQKNIPPEKRQDKASEYRPYQPSNLIGEFLLKAVAKQKIKSKDDAAKMVEMINAKVQAEIARINTQVKRNIKAYVDMMAEIKAETKKAADEQKAKVENEANEAIAKARSEAKDKINEANEALAKVVSGAKDKINEANEALAKVRAEAKDKINKVKAETEEQMARLKAHTEEKIREYTDTMAKVKAEAKEEIAEQEAKSKEQGAQEIATVKDEACLLYTSPSPRDRTRSRMPSSA